MSSTHAAPPVTMDADVLAAEYGALTERCGLIDRSERGKLALTGTGAVEFLNGQVTNDVQGLRPGEGCYAAFLTHKGKMLGDVRILATETELLLDTERSALQALFDMIRRFKIGYQVELLKRTLESGLLSLIGPDSDRIAEQASNDARQRASNGADQHLPAREHAHMTACIGKTPVRLIRTHLGVDVQFDASAASAVREALLAAGASPASEAAAEIVRVEHGLPRYGIDMDDATIPQEAGINERAVSFTKGCYVGQETVARLHYKGKPNRLLRGLRLSEPSEPGGELLLGERSVGHLRSSVVSPRLGPIGLALVRVQAEPGATVSVGDHGTAARVCELPFA